MINELKGYSKIKFNISLDGFSSKSHNLFRNSKLTDLFAQVKSNVALLTQNDLLKGILVTPNKTASIDEYERLCQYAKALKAEYVLFNPLSQFGRGQDTIGLAFDNKQLVELQEKTSKYIDKNFKIIYIRFPSNKKMSSCNYGKNLYMFVNGDIAICPYMAFASENQDSKYKRHEFMLCNVFQENIDFTRILNDYSLPNAKDGELSRSVCNRGCLAVKISKGFYLDDYEDFCSLDERIEA